MSHRQALITFLLAFLLQSTIINNVAIFGVTPNLMLLVVIVYAFLFEEIFALLYGTLIGLIQDICFAPLVGVHCLTYFLVAILIVEIKRFLYRDNFFSAIFLIAGGVTIYNFLFWGIIAIFNINYDFLYMLSKLPVQIILSCILGVIMQNIYVKKVIRYKGDRYI